MAKDPACLFYIDTWLSATAEMDSDVRGWYLNLILHQFDKNSLPNDIEKLASLAGVKFSEFERFKQVFKQVLEQKFELNESNRYENAYVKVILASRDQFKDKRSKSGKIGVVVKLAKSIEGFNDAYIALLKNHLYSLEIQEIEKHKDKHLLKHLLKLYINENENENKYIIDKGGVGEKEKANPNAEIEKINLSNQSISDELKVSEQWIETFCQSHKLTKVEVLIKLDEFNLSLANIFKAHQSRIEYLKHFSNWVRSLQYNNKPSYNQKNNRPGINFHKND
jgi:hypothetical protein